MKESEGYIIFVDDDKEDHELFRMAMAEISTCKILSAHDGLEALDLIRRNLDSIFAIISDINMQRLDGFELKRTIEQTPELKIRAIPFIFHSSVTEPLVVKEAYALGIQGFIEKKPDFQKTISILLHFMKFWSATVHPNIFRRYLPFKE